MRYDDLIVLIPCHSLEDFPTDLPDDAAASLLNAYAVLWHPALLATTGVIPSWKRADEPPEYADGRLILVPKTSADWLPHGWIQRAEADGKAVVKDCTTRGEWVAATVDPLQLEAAIDPDLVADFLAFGTCHLMLELLTRHMHHFSDLDQGRLQREMIPAAKAALANDSEAARTHLRSCFEQLMNARERFYPIECYLIDLCLIAPELATVDLERLAESRRPVNYLASGVDWESIARERPAAISLLRDAWKEGKVDLVGGEYREASLPLLPLESTMWSFAQGQRTFKDLFERTPTTWARRRFGLSPSMPQILVRHGYHAALHVLLDDGLYPDAEQSKMRWEGCDGTIIDAITRIPLAADSAASFLRFAMRLAESMEEDPVAAVILARWPEMKTPWLDDLHRMQAYIPVLGRFVLFREYFGQTNDPGRLSAHDAKLYLTPFFIQAVARQEADPIRRFTDHARRRQRLDAATWFEATAAVLSAQPVPNEPAELVAAIEVAGPDRRFGNDDELPQPPAAELEAYERDAAKRLARVIMHGAKGDGPGLLLLNPLSFPRRVAIDLSTLNNAPPLGDGVTALQFDKTHKCAVVDVPACGFRWIPTTGSGKRVEKDVPLVEEGVLRNEFFEVYINEQTGGIARIKEFGRRPNRISQQIAFRFPRKRTFTVNDERQESEYSEMRCTGLKITSTGPAVAEAVTTGEIIDQKANSRMATFRQTVRVWRGRPFAEVEIELDAERMPEGDPWNNYYAARFAWNDSTATVTRSAQEGAHDFRGERFESPHYIEIVSDEERTTILTCGLPYHRKTGPRMVDSILLAAGDTERKFRFVIAIDQSYPMQAALDAEIPVAVVPTETGPPLAGTSGWFFHLDARNVQITRILDLMDEPWSESVEPRGEQPPATPESGFALRLLETEGRRRQVRIQCYRTPTRARQRDFIGRTIAELRLQDDAVLVDMTPYEIADIELRF